MVNERVICCCGASSWTRVIAWFQIVGNVILIVSILGLIGLAALEVDNDDIPNKKAANAALVIALIISLLGLFMGIILLKGTKERRLGYLRAWTIYGVVAAIISIISLILNTAGSSHSATLGTAVFSVILGIAVNAFAIGVVSIHMKEINEGVFIP